MKKNLIIISLSFILVSCGGDSFVGGQHQENLKRLDKIHGYCDNPSRTDLAKKGIAYNICKDHERALGPDGEMSEKFTLGESFDDLLNRDKGGKTILAQTINKELWNGSLKVLSNYSIKNADSSGGFIETDWIFEEEDTNNRCLIKIQIVSLKLVSNGVETNIVCQRLTKDKWINDNQDYIDEEKQLTLAILTEANKYQVQNQ
tara:strand:+ start:549 stop:1157 length:609 start_codon:yes stop_codon:yes gene_type:complete